MFVLCAVKSTAPLFVVNAMRIVVQKVGPGGWVGGWVGGGATLQGLKFSCDFASQIAYEINQ